MGEVHQIRTRKHEQPSSKKEPFAWFPILVGLVMIAGIIAGAVYLLG